MTTSIIYVDIKSLRAPPWVVKYTILRNKTAVEIVTYAVLHPGVYVFPVVTGTPEECPDYSTIIPDDHAPEWKLWVVQPLYVGNLQDPEGAIQSFIGGCTYGADEVELVDDL